MAPDGWYQSTSASLGDLQIQLNAVGHLLGVVVSELQTLMILMLISIVFLALRRMK